MASSTNELALGILKINSTVPLNERKVYEEKCDEECPLSIRLEFVHNETGNVFERNASTEDIKGMSMLFNFNKFLIQEILTMLPSTVTMLSGKERFEKMVKHSPHSTKPHSAHDFDYISPEGSPENERILHERTCNSICLTYEYNVMGKIYFIDIEILEKFYAEGFDSNFAKIEHANRVKDINLKKYTQELLERIKKLEALALPDQNNITHELLELKETISSLEEDVEALSGLNFDARIKALEENISKQVPAELIELKKVVQTEIAALGTALRAEIAALRNEKNTAIQDLLTKHTILTSTQAALQTQIQKMHTDLTTLCNTVRTESQAAIAAVRKDLPPVPAVAPAPA